MHAQAKPTARSVGTFFLSVALLQLTHVAIARRGEGVLGFKEPVVWVPADSLEVTIPVELVYNDFGSEFEDGDVVIGIMTSVFKPGARQAQPGVQYSPLAEVLTFAISPDKRQQTVERKLNLMAEVERFNESIVLTLDIVNSKNLPLSAKVAIAPERQNATVILMPGIGGLAKNLSCKCHSSCNKGNDDDKYCIRGFTPDWSPGDVCGLPGLCLSRETAISKLSNLIQFQRDGALGGGSCCETSGDCADEEWCDSGICKVFREEDVKSCLRDPSGDFPEDLFTCSQKKKGAFVLHAFGVLYMFAALAIVCDDYFVPALEAIIEKYSIKDDVAGATFMAAGGSAPELFTSIMGVFVAQNDVGFGTIVGSAVFNILLVIGACSLCAGRPLALTWWPLARDASWYLVAILVLYLVLKNDNGGQISLTTKDAALVRNGLMLEPVTAIVWWEAAVLLGVYACYVTFMYFNEQIESAVKSWLFRRFKIASSSSIVAGTPDVPEEAASMAPAPQAEPAKLAAPAVNQKVSGADAETTGRWMNPADESNGDAVAQELRTPVLALDPAPLDHDPSRSQMRHVEDSLESPRVHQGKQPTAGPQKQDDAVAAAPSVVVNAMEVSEEDGDEEEPPEPWHQVPDELSDRVKWALFLPVSFGFAMTIPDCRFEEKKKFMWAAFFLSILWIACYSFFMVWWIIELASALGIPVVVISVTVVAAGTSVPDLITSVIVARAGKGDMAVSSSIGSNIFDLCMGLPLPWLLDNMIVKPLKNKSFGDSYTKIGSEGMEFSLIMLFCLLGLTVMTIILFKWSIGKPMGLFCGVMYFVFIFFTIMAQTGKVDVSFGQEKAVC